jgi:hypothetical protein
VGYGFPALNFMSTCLGYAHILVAGLFKPTVLAFMEQPMLVELCTQPTSAGLACIKCMIMIDLRLAAEAPHSSAIAQSQDPLSLCEAAVMACHSSWINAT